jgi:16S rRNA (uracil1498-N3)-methyltransferase
VNLVLITETEVAQGFPAGDPRTRHLRETVGARIGSTFHVGIENRRRGLATIVELEPSLRFDVRWETAPQVRLPLTVLVGLPRPQTAKKLLHDLASLGVDRLVFFEAEKGDPSYAQSSLWRDDAWREPLLKGAEQACSCLTPEIAHAADLCGALGHLDSEIWKASLDPYVASGPLGAAPKNFSGGCLALGPERGWSEAERRTLADAGFTSYHLGDRILRVETAAVAGASLMLAGLGVWQEHRPLGG